MQGRPHPKDFAGDLRLRDVRRRFELRVDPVTAALLDELDPGTKSRVVRQALKAYRETGQLSELKLRAELHRIDEEMSDLQARRAAAELQLRELKENQERKAAWLQEIEVRRSRAPGATQRQHELWAKARGIPRELVLEVLG